MLDACEQQIGDVPALVARQVDRIEPAAESTVAALVAHRVADRRIDARAGVGRTVIVPATRSTGGASETCMEFGSNPRLFSSLGSSAMALALSTDTNT